MRRVREPRGCDGRDGRGPAMAVPARRGSSRGRRVAGALCALALIAPLGACGAAAAGYDIPVEGPRLSIGIIAGQPGMAVRSGDGYVGFDVSVATYVAGRLGYAPKQIIWKDVAAIDRAKVLDDGTVDLVVANWGITDERKRDADFSSPYLRVRRDLLVRADDARFSDVADAHTSEAGVGEGDAVASGAGASDGNASSGNVGANASSDKADSGAAGADAGARYAALGRALDGAKVCAPAGSTFAQELRADVAPKAQLVAETGYEQCVTDLLAGTVDAIAHDDVILAGFASVLDGQARLVGEPWGSDAYGVGVRKDSPRLVAEVDDALARMMADGSWQRYADALTAAIGYVPQRPDAR